MHICDVACHYFSECAYAYLCVCACVCLKGAQEMGFCPASVTEPQLIFPLYDTPVSWELKCWNEE